MQHLDPEHHDGNSDALPGGLEAERRPGELAFAILMVAASLGLLWSAYGIAGFEALSSPGAIPMATTAVMLISSILIVLKVVKLPLTRLETLAKDILPPVILIFAALLIAYGLLLTTLGFLPTSALFLIVGSLYGPVIDGAPVTFEVRDGLILDTATGSEWNVLGRATAGPLAGAQLEAVVSANHFWFAWSVFEPDTRVIGN